MNNQNPYLNRYNQPYTNQQRTTEKVLEPVHTTPDANYAMRRPPTNEKPTLVAFPNHLFIPDNAQGLDFRKACVITPGETYEIMRYRCPQGATVQFLSYAIYAQGRANTDQLFLPTVNGARVLPSHGTLINESGSCEMTLGLGPDLTNSNLIQCQLILGPGDLLVWTVINREPAGPESVPINMGVRMVGYIDYTQQRVNQRIGG